MIKVKYYRNGSKIKSAFMYSGGFSFKASSEEIFEEIRNNPDEEVKFTYAGYDNKDVTAMGLSLVIKGAQKRAIPKEGETAEFLNKIIRAGGFTEYISKLEKRYE